MAPLLPRAGGGGVVRGEHFCHACPRGAAQPSSGEEFGRQGVCRRRVFEEYIKGRSAPFADSAAAEDSVGLLAQRPSYEAKKRTEILREEKHGIESLPPVPDSSDDEQ